MQGIPLSYSNIQWFGGPQLFPQDLDFICTRICITLKQNKDSTLYISKLIERQLSIIYLYSLDQNCRTIRYGIP